MKTLAVTVAAMMLAAGRTSAAPVRVELRSPNGGLVGNAPAILVGSHVDDNGRRTRPQPVGKCAGGVCEADLSAGGWVMSIDVPHYWSKPHFLAVGADRVTQTWTMYPTMVVRGRMARSPKREDLPGDVSVRFVSNTNAEVSGERDCAVDRATFQCEVPAVLVDLRLRATGRISRYVWDQQPPRDVSGGVDLGSFTFPAGASLVGNVALGKTKTRLDLRSVRVVLTPPADDLSARRVVVMSTHPNAKGFFTFDGVAPGRYSVTADVKGAMTPRVDVVVVAGMEAELRQPLMLDEPQPLLVTVTPARDPKGSRWSVRVGELTDVRGHYRIVEEKAIADDGTWSWLRRLGGKYRLQIVDGGGQVWVTRDVGDTDVREQISVPLRKVRGRVELAGQPVSGTVTITARSGVASVSLETDASGVFDGVAPIGEGDSAVRVRIEATKPHIVRVMEKVPLQRDGDDAAVIDIDLPATKLSGTVVSSDGTPVGDAIVTSKGQTDLVEVSQVRSDSAGAFAFEGLQSGEYSLQARSEHRRSEELHVTVREDAAADGLRLVVIDDERVTLEVVSDAGPVSGARVLVYPTDAPVQFISFITTDPAGLVTATLPPGSKEFDMFVDAPGFAARQLHHLRRGARVTIRVFQEAGELTVDAPAVESLHGDLLWLIHGGAVLPPGAVASSSRCNDDNRRCELRFAALDPGAYFVCKGSFNEHLPAFRAGAMPPDRCASAYVTPGTTARLTLGN